MDAHRLTSGDRFGSGVKTGEATPQALGLDAGGAEPVSLKTPGEAKVSRLAACAQSAPWQGAQAPPTKPLFQLFKTAQLLLPSNDRDHKIASAA